MHRGEIDLSGLAPEDLRRVSEWIEDRFVNAVHPLAIRLQLQPSGMPCSDRTLLAAQWTVKRVLAAVEEVRRIAHDMTKNGDPRSTIQTIPPIQGESPSPVDLPEPSIAE